MKTIVLTQGHVAAKEEKLTIFAPHTLETLALDSYSTTCNGTAPQGSR